MTGVEQLLVVRDNMVAEGLPAPLLLLKNALAQEYSQSSAVAHFDAVQLDEEDGKVVEIGLGEHIEMMLTEDMSREDHCGVMEVTELFEDDKGDRWFCGHWFYKTVDTALAVHGKDIFSAIDKRRIFRASDYDNTKEYATVYPLAAIHRKVRVAHIMPGSDPPADTDYWWDLEHDRRFSTFKDVYPAGIRRQPQPGGQPRVIRCADFYSGCGGLSFMDNQTDKAHITTAWAVDYCQNMTLSFRANYPETEVFRTGVDEWLKLCQYFALLTHQYCPDVHPPAAAKQKRNKSKGAAKGGKGGGSKQDVPAVERVLEVQLGDSAKRGKSGQLKNCLLEPLTAQNSWLEVKLKRTGRQAAWEKLQEAHVPEGLLAAFVQEKRRTKAIPMPGDIDVVMGGPPCQGVSGLNRHSATENILKDGRNRQVTAFYDVVEYFRPAYVLMENVLDILKKEDGTYAKSAMASLLNMRYQVRTGIIAACDQGVPQSRNRIFMWGAKSGEEQLPPFPEPTHRGKRNPVSNNSKQCVVDFPSEAARRSALPMVVMGDIFSDLPKVSNFTFAESAEYASPAQTPLQLWFQRDPPSWQASRESRGQRADAFMREGHAALEKKIRKGEHDFRGVETVGSRFACSSNNRGHCAFSWNRVLSDCKDDQQRRLRQAERDAAIKALHYHTGQEVIRQFEAAKGAKGPVRDHRALCLNLDDHTRVCSVVKAKASNYRSFPGVITHGGTGKSSGKCCAGHWHAAIDADGRSACPGGGHWHKPVRSNQKHSRVDNDDKEEEFPGLRLTGCPASTVWMPSGGLLCPRWCITYKDGKSSGRHGCFGVVWYDEVQPTVVGRAEPHNLALIHPEQDRVLTIRENARTQGFPDYFALVGVATQGKSWVRNNSLVDRYQQMGNAVCPMVASALGRCLALAVVAEAPESLEQAVVSVPDPEFVQCLGRARQMGLKYYSEQAAVDAAAAVAGGGGEATDDEDEEDLDMEEVDL
ncbi:hypothetical protein ABBQ38_014910 [Trebouxia sp. C0009 RCD-2024]